MKRALGVVAASVAAVAGAWVAYHRFAPHETPEGQPGLAALTAESLDDFRHEFNEAAAHTRVVALLSPT